MMIKKVAVATTAVLIAASPLAYGAETSSKMTRPTAADLQSLTDARVAMIKAALQLTPDQEKYWPAVETAIRARAKSRQARWERVAELPIAAQSKHFTSAIRSNSCNVERSH
jgi:LTXXQ motif family protein